jgi:PIN domain nuclease of toxin-antitoxin system
MNFLMDTHTFLWYYSGSPDMSKNAMNLFDDKENNFVVSIASLWEIAIKSSLGKLKLEAPLSLFFQDILDKGFNLLPIHHTHILQSSYLPFHHRDPFDRLLIGQAIAENIPIITMDHLFEPYCQSSGLITIW